MKRNERSNKTKISRNNLSKQNKSNKKRKLKSSQNWLAYDRIHANWMLYWDVPPYTVKANTVEILFFCIEHRGAHTHTSHTLMRYRSLSFPLLCRRRRVSHSSAPKHSHVCAYAHCHSSSQSTRVYRRQNVNNEQFAERIPSRLLLAFVTTLLLVHWLFQVCVCLWL